MLFSTVLYMSAIAGAFAAPASSSLKKCKNKNLTFDIKVRSLEDLSTNILPTSANGQFLVDVGGPAGFSTDATTSYQLSGGLLSVVGTDQFASVKTTTAGAPHQGDIVLVAASAATASGWPLISCTNSNNTLTCSAGNRNYFQVCGKFVNVDPTRNSNCQDHIALDVVPTCKLS